MGLNRRRALRAGIGNRGPQQTRRKAAAAQAPRHEETGERQNGGSLAPAAPGTAAVLGRENVDRVSIEHHPMGSPPE